MAVYRVYKNTNYTVMSNHHLRDKDLSLRAKGMLSVMLMLPDDWKYSISGLAAIVKESASSVRSAVSELRDAGYVRVTKTRDDDGKIRFLYDVFEIPMECEVLPPHEPCVADVQMKIPGLDDACEEATSSESEKPQVETSDKKPYTVEPHTVSCALLNTKEQSTKEQSTESERREKKNKKEKRRDAAVERDVTDAIGYLNVVAGTSFRPEADTHRRLVRARLSEGYTVDDLKAVVDKKCREWSGTERAKYLRPSTLFSKTHFDEYLNQPAMVRGGNRDASDDKWDEGHGW